MILDIVFSNGQTLSLGFKNWCRMANGTYELTLHDRSALTFNPTVVCLWGFRKGDIADDTAERTPTLSS